MGESPRHLYLKQVGKLWLYNQMCHMVDTEVKLNQLGLHRYLELDNKKVIDVVGVGLKYFPWGKRKIQDDEYDDFKLSKPDQYEIGYNVLRGIEVKVSKSDFKNGFICTSANYNYVLAPTKLASPSIVPKGVGLIEFNRYKFSVQEKEDGNPNGRPFKMVGLRVIKRSQYRHIPQFHIDHVISMIAQRDRANREDSFREVLLGMDNRELVYA
jgi:hypothetical protein